MEEAGGEGLLVCHGCEAEFGGSRAVVAGAWGHAAPGEGAPAVGVGAPRGVADGREDDAAEAAPVDPVAVGGVHVGVEEVEPGGAVGEAGEGGWGKVEAQVLGGDDVVAEDDDAAEGEFGESLGLGEAAEDAVAEVAVGADEAGDESFETEEALSVQQVVGGKDLGRSVRVRN